MPSSSTVSGRASRTAQSAPSRPFAEHALDVVIDVASLIQRPRRHHSGVAVSVTADGPPGRASAATVQCLRSYEHRLMDLPARAASSSTAARDIKRTDLHADAIRCVARTPDPSQRASYRRAERPCRVKAGWRRDQKTRAAAAPTSWVRSIVSRPRAHAVPRSERRVRVGISQAWRRSDRPGRGPAVGIDRARLGPGPLSSLALSRVRRSRLAGLQHSRQQAGKRSSSSSEEP